MPSKVIFRTLNRIHIFLYRLSGGKLLGNIVGSPVLLLTTIGRKTNQPRTVPLVYVFDGQKYAVIASDQPAWHQNLKHSSQASIEVQKQTYEVSAQDAEGEDAAQWWAKIIEQSPAFKSFKDSPDHKIVVLTPRH
jgi:deazaflavin-dependent oxidoreductase (nitroreductase family)